MLQNIAGLLGSVQIQAHKTINKLNICRRKQTSVSKYKNQNFLKFYAISIIKPKSKVSYVILNTTVAYLRSS